MRSRFTLVSVVAAVAAAVVGLSACGLGGSGGGDGGQVVATDGPLKGEITYQTWSLKNDKFTPYFTALIKAFQAQHPGTKINWIDQPGDGYEAKVSSQVSSNSLPDVINLPPEFAYQVAQAGSLLDLSKNIPTLTKDYVKSGLDSYKYAGMSGTYGLPWYLGTDVNYWNKALLTKDGLNPANLPKTFDDLIAQAKIMHDRSGGKDYLMSRAPGIGDIVNSGTPMMTADGKKFSFNTPAAEAMLDKYTAAFKAGYLPADVLTKTYEGNSALFIKQVVGWTTGTGNYIVSTAQSNPTLAKQIVPSAAIGTPPLYVQGISVSAKSKNLPLALAFAQFSTNNDNQVNFIKLAQGYLPGTTAAGSNPAFSKSDGTPQGDAAVLAYNALKTAVSFKPAAWTDAMDTYLAQQIALAMTGKQTSKQALDGAVAKCNQLLGA
jgi:multiple sugar transport system substrate-binding protein